MLTTGVEARELIPEGGREEGRDGGSEFNFSLRAVTAGEGHSSAKEPFSPGRAAAAVGPALHQVRNGSSESHLLKTVASGGPWHSEVQGEEALLTRLKDWAKSPPK